MKVIKKECSKCQGEGVVRVKVYFHCVTITRCQECDGKGEISYYEETINWDDIPIKPNTKYPWPKSSKPPAWVCDSKIANRACIYPHCACGHNIGISFKINLDDLKGVSKEMHRSLIMGDWNQRPNDGVPEISNAINQGRNFNNGLPWDDHFYFIGGKPVDGLLDKDKPGTQDTKDAKFNGAVIQEYDSPGLRAKDYIPEFPDDQVIRGRVEGGVINKLSSKELGVDQSLPKSKPKDPDHFIERTQHLHGTLQSRLNKEEDKMFGDLIFRLKVHFASGSLLEEVKERWDPVQKVKRIWHNCWDCKGSGINKAGNRCMECRGTQGYWG